MCGKLLSIYVTVKLQLFESMQFFAIGHDASQAKLHLSSQSGLSTFSGDRGS
jgi:hypothetical protein